jgi:hypothetical protein
MTMLRSIAKGLLWRAGLDVRLARRVEAQRRRSAVQAWRKAWSFIHGRSIRTVIDVGANVGQFAMMVHDLCPEARERLNRRP